ncbi:tannase and feruloyl esterase [Periconia macrospinosa]|uniref:Carboxylic ester hydrolase n=1 Tax=Periconia macrospinosa TaxID=97972 RepID=A0A2V1DSI2_9PLEO|nr:tannase and feruloyl esterase [Periconia macrospinosa]
MKYTLSFWDTLIRTAGFAYLVLPTTVRAQSCTPSTTTSGNCTRGRFANLGVVIDRIGVVGTEQCYWDGPPPIDPAVTLPAYNIPRGSCALIARHPTQSWRFGLILPPANQYKRRFFAAGNGGFNGGINWPDLSFAPHYGAAVVGTDTGHNSSDAGSGPQDGMQWAVDATKRTNWAYQAMDGAVHFGKILTNAYYGTSLEIKRSYYSGCSTGGRQGLKHIQRHANDADKMDGVIITAPAWNLKEMLPNHMAAAIANLHRQADGTITTTPILQRPQWINLTAAAFTICDGKVEGSSSINYNPDGDRVISIDDCFSGNETAYSESLRTVAPGLTDEQRAAAVAIYKGLVVAVNGTSTTVFPGPPPGGEADWSFTLGPGLEATFDQGLAQYWLADARGGTPWAVNNWDKIYKDGLTGKEWVYRESTRAGSTISEPTADDFAAMTNYGGKLMLYHGTADGVIPVASSNRLHQEITNVKAEGDWFRYFQIPGMHHCSWWPNGALNVPYIDLSFPPWYIATATQPLYLGSPKGYGVPSRDNPPDPAYDGIQAMIDWVENPAATPPASLIATAFNGTTTVVRTRKLCPYPQKAALTGSDINDSSSWTCTTV